MRVTVHEDPHAEEMIIQKSVPYMRELGRKVVTTARGIPVHRNRSDRKLTNSWHYRVDGKTGKLTVWNRAWYARYVELGHAGKAAAPRPTLKMALEAHEGKLN